MTHSFKTLDPLDPPLPNSYFRLKIFKYLYSSSQKREAGSPPAEKEVNRKKMCPETTESNVGDFNIANLVDNSKPVENVALCVEVEEKLPPAKKGNSREPHLKYMSKTKVHRTRN